MKAIALETIAFFLIAIVSIMVLISFVGINIPQALKQGYCSLAQGLLGFLPLPESLKPSLPAFCKQQAVQQTVYIEAELPERISFEIAAYTIACWEKTGKINLGQNSYCYEVVIKRISGIVNESTVKDQMPDNYKNILNWQAGEISSPKTIGIYYNSTEKLIWVV
jgi:hypothetical protein